MKPETAGKVKFGVWAYLWAVIAMIIGFAWGGWLTGALPKDDDERSWQVRRRSASPNL